MKLEIDIEKKGAYDVIVVGSGPAGVSAAILAGRNGAKTLLIESCGRVGGISTSGMMSHFTGRCGNMLYHEILERAAEKNVFAPGKKTISIDPEFLTLTYIEMLEEAKVDILLYTTFCDVMMDGNTVTGIICHNKGGFCAYDAKVVIDASGDGDVAYKSGAEYFKGRETDGKMQPATLMFKVGGVDMDRAVFPRSFETLVDTEKGELQALAREKLPHPAGHVLLYRSTIPGIVTCNMTNVIDVDGTVAEDLTKAEIVCRKQMPLIVDFLREYVPGYENCYIIGSASLIGIRETRHFKGVQTLTEQEIAEAHQHEDYVVYDAHFNFDVHNITGAGLDKTGCQHNFKQQNGYTIPYGCMVPEKIDGLLLSGRNISGTHMAHSNYRVMPICIGIGEACGTAAALAVKNGKQLREIKAEEIRKLIGLE
ncbi:MAG: FAD-dependent oxidoreductase [Ruminococcaceae bacterium]|nr:FAD-dependent oxidoreductase [Oscillospiraceae bacterium]